MSYNGSIDLPMTWNLLLKAKLVLGLIDILWVTKQGKKTLHLCLHSIYLLCCLYHWILSLLYYPHRYLSHLGNVYPKSAVQIDNEIPNNLFSFPQINEDEKVTKTSWKIRRDIITLCLHICKAPWYPISLTTWVKPQGLHLKLQGYATNAVSIRYRNEHVR